MHIQMFVIFQEGVDYFEMHVAHSIKKKENKKKKGKKVEKREFVSRTTFLLISHNPFYNNPILTDCTNYGLNF